MKKNLTKTKLQSILRVARPFIISRSLGSVLVILVSLVLTSGNAWAGTPALEGTVKDASGQPIRGADVRIEARNFAKLVKTDASGHYISGDLPLGTVKVTLLVNGSVKASTLNARSQLGKPTQLNFDLTAKTVSAKRHTHSVWASTPTGTRIGGTGQWIDVYDDTGLPVDNNTQPSTATSSIEKVGGSALQTLRTNPGRAHGPFSASGIGGE
jgi:hypothetical protein